MFNVKVGVQDEINVQLIKNTLKTRKIIAVGGQPGTRKTTLFRKYMEGKNWIVTQMPEVQSAFVAASTTDGAIKALVGGFDYNLNKFNHVTQAWRQPGSSFKPFIYSASLEKGFSPATMIADEPISFDAGQTGGQAWEPKNYDGKYEGPMTMRKGLTKSKNMISIRVLQSVGAQNAQDWISKFGFDAEKHPPYLTMALGAGSVTPMQMVSGYSVFANGGFRVNPYLITRVLDKNGKELHRFAPIEQDDSQRAIAPRNAFMMSQLLNEVTRSGTAARAQATLQRPDLFGKTGTTNGQRDAWFAGFNSALVTTVWVGKDNNETIAEYGANAALPIWIEFMGDALAGSPSAIPERPSTVISARVDASTGRRLHDDQPGRLRHRHRHLVGDGADQVEVIAVAGAVAVHRGDEQLARAQFSQPQRVFDRIDPGRAPSAMGEYLPTIASTPRVDAGDAALAAEAVGEEVGHRREPHAAEPDVHEPVVRREEQGDQRQPGAARALAADSPQPRSASASSASSACRTWFHPPEVICTKCGCEKLSFETASGRGTIYSYSVMYDKRVRGFEHRVPYVSIWVELEEQKLLHTMRLLMKVTHQNISKNKSMMVHSKKKNKTLALRKALHQLRQVMLLHYHKAVV